MSMLFLLNKFYLLSISTWWYYILGSLGTTFDRETEVYRRVVGTMTHNCRTPICTRVGGPMHDTVITRLRSVRV